MSLHSLTINLVKLFVDNNEGCNIMIAQELLIRYFIGTVSSKNIRNKSLVLLGNSNQVFSLIARVVRLFQSV